MKTTLKTIALSLLVFVSTASFAGNRNEKVVSAELDVQIVRMADQKVAVKFDKQDGELVKVRIYDTFGSLIYADKEASGTAYFKSFDLSAFPAGNYTYKVSNDVYAVSKVIKKNYLLIIHRS